MAELLIDGPETSALTVALAHGAGAPMDSPFMAFFAAGLAAAGWRVVRFEFPYMQATREDGMRRPPDRTDVLMKVWHGVIADLGPGRLIIGGKSLGGRIASMVADRLGVRGVVCLGYPFHPPGKADRLRTEHLATLATPTLIIQGTRDEFGNRDEVAGYPLSPAIRLHWIEEGDHGFRPRAASGRTDEQSRDEALGRLLAFLDERRAD